MAHGSASPDQRAYRLSAVDALRGLVIVIMALDHVRDFFLAGTDQDPMAHPDIGVALFLTRWVTHFCAPVFVLLAGTSAGLMAGRRSRRDLARFLLTRGLWLIAIEVFVIATAFTFAPGGIPEVGGLVAVPMQVIWAIGASMVALAAFQALGRRACLVVGLAVVAGHNLLDPFWPASELFAQQPLWVTLHAQMSSQAGPFLFLFAYPVLAWVGVMLVGFGISGVFERPADERNRWLTRAGLALVAGFVVLRAAGLYGDPNPWISQPSGVGATVLDFINTTKYPPSLLFLMMTLGPAALACAVADRMQGRLKDTLVMFGRVPFAFYVAHFYLIHLLSIGLGVMQGFEARQFLTVFLFYPKGYGLDLPGVYGVWCLVVALLYPLCRWVAHLKARRKDWWLSYV